MNPATEQTADTSEKAARVRMWFVVALVMVPTNAFAWWMLFGGSGADLELGAIWAIVLVLALAQVVFATLAFVALLRRRQPGSKVLGYVGASMLVLLGVTEGLVGTLFVALSGAAWGRPLRVRGRLLHPGLKHGADWSRGEMPSVEGLDPATRRALEALWLHDAQKEHASVPAFARITWLLCAAGAPPRLIEWSQRAGLEEADHACRCFALAAGYGGRSHSVETMPELLVAGLEIKGSVLALLARESLMDGCLLEDFNADVAAQCAKVCVDPATRGVLVRIAEEERSHAEFSWSVLEWALERGGELVAKAIAEALDGVTKIPRPTATSRVTEPLVARADTASLRTHGRIADGEWAVLWPLRQRATLERARQLLGEQRLPRKTGLVWSSDHP